ncbi:MAG TPA: EVE domain-containing protein [Candidatus Dormibacteraeota bacterium]|nr:EVE domain-containing protein [Candidatus Dormibacteraeota bacterium]
MNYWLVKSEPGTYGWADLVRDGRTVWDGVRNFQARNNLRAMKAGDRALFYHSVNERSVLGVARIASDPYPDPKAKDWTVVDVEPDYALEEPVTLDRIKDEKALQEMVLLRQSRLSVQPVRKAEFEAIVKLGGRAR